MLTPEVLAPWGRADLLDRASGGYVNDVWFARVRGEECVVRASKRSADALQWEVELLLELDAKDFGVPAIVPTTDGRCSVAGVVVFRQVVGRRPATSDDWARVREYLVRLHAAFRDRRQRPGFLSAVDLVTADAGGLVDLGALPDDAVALCRAAWRRLSGMPRAVVHGDANEENIFVTDDRVVLIDWDEARVDAPAFDLAALPDDVSPLSDEERWVAHQAASAWEAAISWKSDNEYARWRLSQVAEAS